MVILDFMHHTKYSVERQNGLTGFNSAISHFMIARKLASRIFLALLVRNVR